MRFCCDEIVSSQSAVFYLLTNTNNYIKQIFDHKIVKNLFEKHHKVLIGTTDKYFIFFVKSLNSS